MIHIIIVLSIIIIIISRFSTDGILVNYTVETNHTPPDTDFLCYEHVEGPKIERQILQELLGKSYAKFCVLILPNLSLILIFSKHEERGLLVCYPSGNGTTTLQSYLLLINIDKQLLECK